MATTVMCSFEGCKRPVTCLCHHCQKNVCFKHFNEHQAQINSELVPLADRLNELRMKLQIKDDRTGVLAMLKTWREKKYEEIDQEYKRKVQEFNENVLVKEKQVSQTIREIEELVKEGDTSINQVKELKKSIELMENQVNKLTNSQQTKISSENNITESNLVNTHVRIGGQNYFVKEKVHHKGTDCYSLVSEKSTKGCDESCSNCSKVHDVLEPSRGIYVYCEWLHGHRQKIHQESNKRFKPSLKTE